MAQTIHGPRDHHLEGLMVATRRCPVRFSKQGSGRFWERGVSAPAHLAKTSSALVGWLLE